MRKRSFHPLPRYSQHGFVFFFSILIFPLFGQCREVHILQDDWKFAKGPQENAFSKEFNDASAVAWTLLMSRLKLLTNMEMYVRSQMTWWSSLWKEMEPSPASEMEIHNPWNYTNKIR
ncbi:MAG: hypothetical protein SH808_05495 [Saprospiraceae bacterium]|nr:hypothetical protein [Saprospiraceae bacterium]